MTHYTSNDRQMAGIALQFLRNTNLTGDEAQSFLLVNKWLQGIITKASHSPERVDTFVDDGPGTTREHQD